MYQHPLITVKLLALFLFIQNIPAVCQTESQEQQIDQFFSEWNNPETPGASVAIVKDGRIIFKKGYGSANLDYSISNSPATVFNIASVSKQFTAFAVLLLESQGKLSLDDDVRKHIPEIPDFGKVVTLKHLLNHTSGLCDEFYLLGLAGWRLDDVITLEQMLNLVYTQKELNFIPGNDYQYSNTGYTLLAEVVSRVSAEPFASFTRKHIFLPLQMTNSFFNDDHENIIKNCAYSYYFDGKEYKKNVLNSEDVGSSNLYTTVEDLSRWALNFENPVVGSKKLIEKMNERGILNNGDTISYALGQDVLIYKGLKVINHGGATAGYRSVLGRLPDQHFSVIVLSNNASIEPQEIAVKISEIYLKDQFIEENIMESAPTPTAIKEFSGDPEMLVTFCGKYQLRPEFMINISSENEKLFVEAHEVPKTQLIRVSQTEFSLPAMNATLVFTGDIPGEINRLNVDLNGQKMSALKIQAFDVATVNPDEFRGNFFSPELGTVYTFVAKNGQLIGRNVRMPDFIMNAVRQDQFKSENMYFKNIEFIRDDKSNVTGCWVSAGRNRCFRFDKISL